MRGDIVNMEVPWLWDAQRPFVLAMSWQENPDGSLSFEYVDGDPRWEPWMRATIADRVWIRIGDA